MYSIFQSIWGSLEIFYSKISYLILIVIAILISYISLKGILTLPEPSTIPNTYIDYLVFYLHNTKEYLIVMLESCVAFGSLVILSLSTIYNTLELSREYDMRPWISVLIISFGVVIGLVSLYFLMYSFILFAVLAITGLALMYGSSSTGGKRRRGY